MPKAQKKLAAATLTRRIDQWCQDVYGESVLDDDSQVQDTSLATFINDVREAEFRDAVRQIPGQTAIEADDDGTVRLSVVPDDEDE